jgi:hypothetical protein
MKFTNDERRVCVECKEHRALFRFRGRVRRDEKHTLCFRCFRSQQDSLRATRTADTEA